MCLASCDDYDDTGLWNKVNGLEERIAALEEWQKTTDNNLNALQTLVNTMDYITSVAPIMQAGDTIGYTINFYQSNPLSIYNGTTSQIGITQDEEGNWLWTLDGEVLTTPEGTPIPANGQDAAAPQLSTGKALQDEGIKTDAQGNAITADIAYLSVDGGETWYRVTGEKGDKGEQGDKGNTGSRGPAGADGDSFFKDKDVTVNDDSAVFTLANGTTFSIPLYTGIKLNFGTQSSISLVYGDTETVSFTAEGSDSFTTDNLFLIAPNGWEASIAAQTRALPSTAFTLTVTAPSKEQVSAGTATASGEILVLLDNGQGNTTIGRIKVTAANSAINGTELTAVNLQTGELATAIGSHADLTSITVTSGTLNSTDWTAIKQNKAALLYLDLEGATYTGTDEANLVYSNNTTVPLKEVKLPQGVTVLGPSAFNGCSDLTDINLPEGVTTIGNLAFRDCSSLTSITLPDGVTSIGVSAFNGCSSLTSIDLPDKLTSIGVSAFNGCSSLASINLPDGLTSIGNSAFNGCSALTDINLPDGVTSIGVSAFNGCSSLTTITLPEGVTSIGNNAFQDCSSLTSINLPEGLKSIGQSAFQNCSALTTINLPEGLTSIGVNAFRDCSDLASVTLPEGLKSIGSNAFYGCSALATVTCLAITPPTVAGNIFTGCDDLTAIYVPAGSVDDYTGVMEWAIHADKIQSMPGDS